jgi:predicted nucleotidyltransferase
MRLFGSVARGEHHEGSDVDIFFTMPPKFFNHIEAAQYLEQPSAIWNCGTNQ